VLLCAIYFSKQMTDILLEKPTASITHVILNRPAKLNALTLQ